MHILKTKQSAKKYWGEAKKNAHTQKERESEYLHNLSPRKQALVGWLPQTNEFYICRVWP